MAFVRAGFADEYCFYADEHAAFMGKNGLAASVRWVSFDSRLGLDPLSRMTLQEIDSSIPQWKKEGLLKHVTALNYDELVRYKSILDKNGVGVFDIGSGVLKVRQTDTGWAFAAMQQAAAANYAADALGTRRIRMFSTYPQSADGKAVVQFHNAWNAAVEAGRDIGQFFQSKGKVGFVEDEANLIGGTGAETALYVKMINNGEKPFVLAYYDGANIVRMDKHKTDMAYRGFLELWEAGILGGFHLKDCPYNEKLAGILGIEGKKYEHVRVGTGAGGYDRIAKFLMEEGRNRVSQMEQTLLNAGLSPQIGLIHEPHLRDQTDVGGLSLDGYVSAILGGDALIRAYSLPVQPFV